MKKKFSIVIAVFCLIIIANWVYGRVLSSNLEKKLSETIAQSSWAYRIKYDHVRVNPLLSSLKLYGFVVEDDKNTLVLKSKLVELDMPYSEAIRLLESDKFEEIESFTFIGEDLVCYDNKGVEEAVIIKELLLDFDGHLTQEDIETVQSKFPVEEQKIDLEVNNIEFVNRPLSNYVGAENANKDLFTTVKYFETCIHFDPKKKEIELEKFEIDSKLFHHVSELLLRYEGDGLNDMKPHWASSKAVFELNKKGVKWGDPELTGEFRLKDLYLETEGEYGIGAKGKASIYENETHFRMKGLQLEYKGDMKKKKNSQTAMLGVDMSELEVRTFEYNSSLKDNTLKIEDTELRCSFLDADLEAKIDLNQKRPDKSEIQSAKIVLSDIAPGLEKGIGTLELMMGKNFPRNGEDIVLELSGSLLKPDIKGMK